MSSSVNEREPCLAHPDVPAAVSADEEKYFEPNLRASILLILYVLGCVALDWAVYCTMGSVKPAERTFVAVVACGDALLGTMACVGFVTDTYLSTKSGSHKARDNFVWVGIGTIVLFVLMNISVSFVFIVVASNVPPHNPACPHDHAHGDAAGVVRVCFYCANMESPAGTINFTP